MRDKVLIKSTGREMLTAYIKNKNNIVRFWLTVYNTPKFRFKETNPIRIETKNIQQLNLDIEDYPKSYINFKSNHPEIVKVTNDGKITALRPGYSIITAKSLDDGETKIKVLVISNNGFLNNYMLDNYNASKYQNVMIVSHPDDETLWGGANLYKDQYFVVCLTNGFNLKRANDYRQLLKFTKNDGIILNYPDTEDNIRDDWSEVKTGILKDLSTILNYKKWDKIVTYGPDGTYGHIHHKMAYKYVTNIAKETNNYKNLYYFGKYYSKNQIPKNLLRINDEELKNKIKELNIYKSEKACFRIFFHMIPYENWVLASEWK